MKNIILSLTLVVSIVALVIALMNNSGKLAYIEMGKVYDEFSLSKQLNGELNKVVVARQTIIDSLFEDLRKRTMELKSLKKKSIEDVEKVSKIEEEYLYKKQMFEKDNQSISADINAKIWNQINQYVADFGKDKKLTLVFGANGQGNIMYGDETKNLTKEVVEYVNSKYNGITKK